MIHRYDLDDMEGWGGYMDRGGEGRVLDLARNHNTRMYGGSTYTETPAVGKWQGVERVEPGEDYAKFKEAGRVRVGDAEYVVGEDLRLYREFEGIGGVKGWECASGGKSFFTYPDKLPPLGAMLTIFEHFFKKYDREVMMFWGWDRKSPDEPVFMVPKQVGTAGSVDWDDEAAMKAFVTRAQYCGTIHVHPGASNAPSFTDYGNWKKDGGLHFIWGRDGSLNVTASDCRHYCTWKIDIPEKTAYQKQVKYMLSPSADKDGLRSLLLVPAKPEPVVYVRDGGGKFAGHGKSAGSIGRTVERGIVLFEGDKYEDSAGKDAFLADFLKECGGKPPLQEAVEGSLGLSTMLIRNVYDGVFGPVIPFMIGLPTQKLPVCIMSVTNFERFRNAYPNCPIKVMKKLAKQLRSIRTC